MPRIGKQHVSYRFEGVHHITACEKICFHLQHKYMYNDLCLPQFMLTHHSQVQTGSKISVKSKIL